MRTSTALCLALAAGSLLATPVAAVDGVIEINQAKALAGGVTTGDGAGFPVLLTQPGSYRLTGNLDLTSLMNPQNVTAIEIAAQNVTIDLNGFTIRGSTTCNGQVGGCLPVDGTGVGIFAQPGASWTTIRNGVVRGMGLNGIALNHVARIEGVTVSDNRVLGLSTIAGSVIRSCHVYQNGTDGALTGAYAVVEGNVFQNNGGLGLQVAGFGTVSGNTFAANGGVGLSVGPGTVVLGNAMANNTGVGLEIVGSGCAYGQNTLNGNNSNGPQVNGAATQFGSNVCEGDTDCP